MVTSHLRRHLSLASVSAALVLSSASALAAIQQHTFTITGDNGETGTGTFTWDDAVVADGNLLELADLLSVTINLSGGNVVGGTTSFTLADCSWAFLLDTPDFTNDINWACDNGSNTLLGVLSYTNSLNSGQSTLTFTPGAMAEAPAAAVEPVPVAPVWLLGLTAAVAGLFGLRRIKRAQI